MKTFLSLILFNFFLTGISFAQTSGWGYENQGGFEKVPYNQQEPAPDMTLVDGATYSDKNKDHKKIKRTLEPFYIGINEETNGQYLAYLNYIRKCYSKTTYEKALPDTTVWLKEHLSVFVNNYLMNNYFRNPAYKDYPVVGVSAEQVLKYALWKSDRTNEMILVREGLLDPTQPTDSSLVFTTESYLAGHWGGQLRQKLPSFDEVNPERDVRMEDGIFIPNCRMLTKDEWLQAIDNGVFQRVNKPTKQKEIKDFWYLFTTGKKSKHPKPMDGNGVQLFKVYDTPGQGKFLNGLLANVSEWVVDSSEQYVAMGDSWRDDYRSYPQRGKYSVDSKYFYTDQSVLDTLAKIFPEDFSKTPAIRGKVSSAVGFRLAMDYFGPIAPASIRRKR